MLESALQFVPVFVLVAFRLAGMALYAPLFGSARIPRRVRGLLVVVMAAGMAQGVKPPAAFPETPWGLAVAIGGEMAFGLAMGMLMSFVFIAVQWAGEMIGQQMGLNLGAVFDPQFGAQSTVTGDLYFMFTLVVFLAIGGHRAMIQGVRASFDSLPLLSLAVDRAVLQVLMDLLKAATVLAFQLAAPILVTMLIVDLVLGLIGRTIPQLNVMALALNLRSALGILVVLLGIQLTGNVIGRAIDRSMQQVTVGWTRARPPAAAPTP